jgi:predicted nucleic acid-binding protein
VFPQNLAEFWNVCTRPAGKNGLGLEVAETERRLSELEAIVSVIHDTRRAYSEWCRLIVRHGVKGVQVHDARLVAGMKANSIDRILTHNPKDFERYDGITAVHPKEITRSGFSRY